MKKSYFSSPILASGPDCSGVLGISQLTCWHPDISLGPHPINDMRPGSTKKSRLHGDHSTAASSLWQRVGGCRSSFNGFQILCEGSEEEIKTEAVGRPGSHLTGASLLQSVAAVVMLVSPEKPGPEPGKLLSSTERPRKGSKFSGTCSSVPLLGAQLHQRRKRTLQEIPILVMFPGLCFSVGACCPGLGVQLPAQASQALYCLTYMAVCQVPEQTLTTEESK